jgi:very-short-patch-repair endonuclease
MAPSIARSLRRNPTEGEQRLWSRLRHQQLDGFRFRRQVPLGPYVVDPACLPARLIVEVDGGQHGWQGARAAMRTAWLEAAGCRVVRFWNNDVLANSDGVIQRMREILAARPPRPCPARGAGERAVARGEGERAVLRPPRNAHSVSRPARTSGGAA